MNTPINKFIALVSLLATTQAASAAFVLVDNFDGDTLGAVNGQTSAVGTAWTGNVGADPTVATFGSGKAVQWTAANMRSRLDMGAAQGVATSTTGTLFMQFQIDDTGSQSPTLSFGISDLSNAFNFNSASTVRGAQLYISGGGPNYSLSDRSGAGYTGTIIANNTIVASTLYSVWFVLNNTAGTYDVYIQGGSGAYATQTALATNVAFATDSAVGTLRYFAARSGGASAGQDPFWIDNIYVDVSGQNLGSPVPEPSTYAAGLGVVALLAAALRRRLSA